MSPKVGARTALGLLLLAGTAMGLGEKIKFVTLTDAPAADESVHFTVVDSRRRADSRDGYVSTNGLDCECWTYRIGDQRTNPQRLLLLQRDLVARLGHQLDGKTLEITSYAIYVNQAAYIRWSYARGSPGDFGAPVMDNHQPPTPSMGSRCEKERTSVGYYAPWEATTFFSPVIVEIRANYEGRALEGRSVFSPNEELHVKSYDSPEQVRVIFGAMRKATDELAVAMGAAPPTT
jgi:hypothetical protein